MPLLDHFRPPLFPRRSWEAFHSNWATEIANELCRILPPSYVAEEQAHVGSSVEIDVATLEDALGNGQSGNGSAPASVLSVATPTMVLPGARPSNFEILILQQDDDRKLVGAIELVSPGNKDRPAHRRGFATKCANFLYQGVSLILVDVVTSRSFNLHNETLDVMNLNDAALRLGDNFTLYVTDYRPVLRNAHDEIDTWAVPLSLGDPLPVKPLGLREDLIVPVDLESTYAQSCRNKRLA